MFQEWCLNDTVQDWKPVQQLQLNWYSQRNGLHFCSNFGLILIYPSEWINFGIKCGGILCPKSKNPQLIHSLWIQAQNLNMTKPKTSQVCMILASLLLLKLIWIISFHTAKVGLLSNQKARCERLALHFTTFISVSFIIAWFEVIGEFIFLVSLYQLLHKLIVSIKILVQLYLQTTDMTRY